MAYFVDRTQPLALVSGKWAEEEYLSNARSSFPAILWLNSRLQRRSRTLVIGLNNRVAVSHVSVSHGIGGRADYVYARRFSLAATLAIRCDRGSNVSCDDRSRMRGQTMEGIHFVTNEKGKKIAVQIDLERYGEIWESVHDRLVAASREREKSVPFDAVARRPAPRKRAPRG